MDRKIKVLVMPSDTFGVGLYRSVSPHTKLQELYGDEFDVEINYQPNWSDLASLDKYDIIHVHKGLFGTRDNPNGFELMEVFWKAMDYCKEHNITTIIDIDDNWDVGPQHPLYLSNKAMKAGEKITTNFRKADYVTTTTEIFAERVRKYNKNVLVFPNSIDPDEEQYLPIKNPSDRIRFGFIMGSSHEKDMEQFKGVVNSLPKDVKDKIQIVLCGFDLRGSITMMDKDGNVTGTRDIQPKESVWYKYEQIVTDNYNIVSPEYKDFLMQFMPNTPWPDVKNEGYRREWTKDVKNFAKHYRNVDVLIAPLDCNEFNKVKSELKFAEAGFTHTALICSDFGPYNLVGKSIFKFGGEIDNTGNCILVEQGKAHKDWAKAIKKLVANPELITMLQNNLSDFAHEYYDINKVTARRAEWYKSIVKKTL